MKPPDKSGSLFSNLSVVCNNYIELVYPSAPVIFRHRDGLPIRISAKVIAEVCARCIHGIDNLLFVPIKPSKIEWLIEGEKKSSGAFKVGHADNAEYLSRDYDECVIYHPPPDSNKTQEIQMRLKLKHATGDSEHRIYVALQMQEGFGKGISSSANVTLESATTINRRSHENKNCEICKPELIFDKPDSRIVLAGMIEDGRYLMTSEYIKMVSHADEKGRIWIASNDRERVLLDGLSPDLDLEWQCSAGSFAGTNRGNSIIYLTPDESELSKSPITIMLQADGKSVATRRFWLLRRPSVMHC